MRRLIIMLIVMALMVPVFCFAADDDLLMAMKAELNRTKTLSMPDFDPPYFVSYSIDDTTDIGYTSEFGGVLAAYNNRARRGRVEVRVGDYAFDNSGKGGMENYFDMDHDFEGARMYLKVPLDDDIDAIRAQLWLVTDTMYKKALIDLLRKKGKRVYMVEKDVQVDSFSKEKPTTYVDHQEGWDVDYTHWRDVAKKAGALFKRYPSFTQGYVSVRFSTVTRRLVNTEGTTILDGGKYFEFQAFAQTQAEDGQKLDNYFTYYARSEKGLPDEKQLYSEIQNICDELIALKTAEKMDPFTGPAILDPTLAGVFFHEAVGHRLEGERQNNTEEGHTFKNKVGEKILPEFLSLYDDPTQTQAKGRDLFGTYKFDSEGVPAQPVELVKAGVLKGFLMSRAPIEGFTQSNGHGRSDGQLDPMARMGVTIVKSNKTASAEKMKKQLMKLAKAQGKDFGLILKKGQGGETSTSKYNFQAFRNSPTLIYKVDAKTGEETLVRGAEVVGTPLVSLNKVVVAGKDLGIFNGYCGAESGWVPVSAVAPSLLISEIELQRTQEKTVKPPILPPPYGLP